ncbi:unnamed protein product [Linum trigynum]|uniref:UNC93-like protein 1 n=1 Tax=Linum trigynum TaxID=586398 RepID=A0AAV2E4R8_9ROSI
MGSGGDQESGGVATTTTTTTKSKLRYNSPLVQVVLIGLVCFCCPGMFNALSGMGAGGQVDPTAANNALYTTFAVFGGGFYNNLGPRLTLAAGCSTYVLYAGSFLYYNLRIVERGGAACVVADWKQVADRHGGGRRWRLGRVERRRKEEVERMVGAMDRERRWNLGKNSL